MQVLNPGASYAFGPPKNKGPEGALLRYEGEGRGTSRSTVWERVLYRKNRPHLIRTGGALLRYEGEVFGNRHRPTTGMAFIYCFRDKVVVYFLGRG
jgi:hypothetical protein